MKWLKSTVLIAAAASGFQGPAAATPLNLVTGFSAAVAPGESTVLDIAVTNQAPGDVTNFNAFLLAFQLLPQPGATGSLTITGVAQPATSAMLSDPEVIFTPSGSVAPETVNGSSEFVGAVLANNDPDAGDPLAAGDTANLVSLSVATTAGSGGTWTLYAITNAIPISAWQTTESIDDIAFGNLPFPASGSVSSLELGTVTVSTVPEPTAMLFAALLGLVVIGAGRRVARGRPLARA
jgi:hypothetical protein